jgi:hypothetical protein
VPLYECGRLFDDDIADMARTDIDSVRLPARRLKCEPQNNLTH